MTKSKCVDVKVCGDLTLSAGLKGVLQMKNLVSGTGYDPVLSRSKLDVLPSHPPESLICCFVET